MSRASVSERGGPEMGRIDPFGDVAAPPLRRGSRTVLLHYPASRVTVAGLEDPIAQGHRALRRGIIVGLLLAASLVLGAVLLRHYLDLSAAEAPTTTQRLSG